MALMALAVRAGDVEAATVMKAVMEAPTRPRIGFCRTEPVATPEMLLMARKSVEVRLGMTALMASATAAEA
jgi:hypothetical protein